MVIRPSTLDAIFLAFDTIFQQAYLEAPVMWDKVATRVPSSTKEQRHGWLKKLPQLREWIGERQVNNLSANLQALVNKKFEFTLGIDREEIEDDTLGLYNPMMAEVGASARQWPDKLVFDALQAGASNTCYDGQNFFSTAHPVNADDSSLGTQSNYYSSGKTLSPTNYDLVRTAMMSLKGEDGVPMNIQPTHLIVPPQLEMIGRQILQSEIIAATGGFGASAATGSTTNVLKSSAELVVVPRLANEGTRWYLACLNRAVKPLIFQERIAPNFSYKNSETDDNVFSEDKFLFGVRARGAGGYGPWQLIASAQT